MDIFYAPFCFRGVRSTFGHYDDMMMMMMIEQSLWWEHRNTLEKLRNHTVLRRDLLKALHSCQNRVVSSVRACPGKNKRQLSQQFYQITHVET